MQEATITHLERRKIEVGVLIPMVQAFQRAIGRERADEITRGVIMELARKEGEQWAQRFGRDVASMELAVVDLVTRIWGSGGSLVTEPIGKSTEGLDFNIVRCHWAEFYKELGIPDLGYLLHCTREFGMVEGINPSLTLKRTQTIMQGASYCDFRFLLKG